MGTFVIPALLSWKRPGIDREASGTADILRSVMATLVGSLLETPVDDEAQKPALSRAVKKYLDASYDNPDLDVAMVAERFNLSRRSLFYFFENEELHLGERIRALRTRRALELLLQADAQRITYSEIAASCGFTNVQSMRRAVKEFTGNLSRRSLFYFFENEELHLGERIRALRTRRALELLLQADAQRVTYSEIAASCGFSNVQSMRRAVKEFTGMNVREIHRSETVVRVALQQLRESLIP